MPISGLTDNQMVTEGVAAGAGFALNSGQSHGSGNLCMTKLVAITRYNLEPNFGSYANNQLVPAGLWAVPVVYYTQYIFRDLSVGASATCSTTIGNLITVYTSTTGISVGTTIYASAALTTTFNGGGYAHLAYPGNERLYTINTVGVVTAITLCTAPDTTPPTNPSGLTSSQYSASEVSLNWTASTDNSGGIVYYEIHRSTTSSTTGFSLIGETSINNYYDPSVAPETTYWYKVVAFDSSGNLSGFSNVVSQYIFDF